MRTLVLLVALGWFVPPAMAEDAVTRGEAAFKMCGACHSIGEGATHRLGPELNGVLGAPAATRPDFAYSQTLLGMSAEGLVWNHDTLTRFLRRPRDFAPGTKMAFAGITDDGRIGDIIAYLATFSPDYVPEDTGRRDKGPKNPPRAVR